MTRHAFFMRMRHMLFGWGFVGVIYSLGAVAPAQGFVLHETAFDRWVPFHPAGVWVYLSFFVLVGGSFLALPLAQLPRLTRSFQIAALVSGAAFVLWPTQLAHGGVVNGEGISADLLRLLDRQDTGRNCLPSLHAALTWLCVREWIATRRRLLALGAAAWGVGMLHAILQARRHLALDIAAGWAVGWVAGALADRWSRRRPHEPAPKSADDNPDRNDASKPWRTEEATR